MLKRLLLVAFAGTSAALPAQFSGNALDFDGANDMVVVSSVPSIFSSPATNDFTIEAWVYPRGSTFQRIFFAQPATNNFATFGTGSGNVIYFYVVENGTTFSVATTTSITQNQWTHVAVRWTTAGNTVEVFFNGVLQPGANGGTSSTGTSGLMVLGSRPGGFQYFNGSMDEVRVWSEARTDCEIQNNYMKSLNGAETNLVADYDFNQGVAGGNNAGVTTLPDVSGSGYAGTLTNFALSGTTSNWISSTASITTSGASVSGYAYSETAFVCSGGSYTFPDGTTQTNIISQTTHVSTISGGCDTIITTTVNVNAVYNMNDTAVVCSGSSYTFPDSVTVTNITATVSHTSNLLTVQGCDSVINTVVNVLQPTSYSESFTVCEGDTFTFPDSTSMIITSPTSHQSTLVNSVGCDSVITTQVFVNPTYNFSDSVWVCYGGNYTFPDGTTFTGITAPTSHMSSLNSASGCDSTINTIVSITQVDTSVTVLNETLTSNETANATYQWIDCGNGNQPIAGETNQSYTATANGTYAVIVTVDGCSDTSGCHLILSTALNATSELIDVLVYPNPVTDQLTIFVGDVNGGVVEICDLTGQVIRQEQFSNSLFTMNVNDLAAGNYLLKLHSERGSGVKLIMIQ